MQPSSTPQDSGRNSAKSAPPSVAVIGCGAAAQEFYLPVLRSLADSTVLVDPLQTQRESVGQRFGMRKTACDYRDLGDDVQAVFIATPHHLHAEQAAYFLERNCHVFVEKPLTTSAAETKRLMDAATASTAVLMVNNYRRLFPSYGYVRDMLQRGDLGAVRRIVIEDGTEFGWNSATSFYMRDRRVRGVLLDRGAHTVDVVHWWLGQAPTVVRAWSDSRDAIEGRFDLQLQSGDATVNLKFSRFERLANTFTITCDQGKIEGRLFDFARLKVTQDGVSRQIVAGEAKPHQEYAWQLARNFVDVVRGIQKPLFTAADVAPSMITLADAYARAELFAMPWYQDDPNLAYLKSSR